MRSSRFLAAAELELGIPRKIALVACLKRVRRIRLRSIGASRFGAHPDRGDVGYDRVDALTKMYRMAPATRTHALLDVAIELLGPLLRDRSLIRDIATSYEATPGLPRAAMIALALLGEGPESEEIERCRAGDAMDGRALLLAVTVAGHRAVGIHFEDPSLALAQRRPENGRILTALG